MSWLDFLRWGTPSASSSPVEYFGNYDDSLWVEMISLPREYAGKYWVNGWDVDATVETHLRWRTESSVRGFTGGPAGCVLVLTPDTVLEPQPNGKQVWIWGVNTCPRCNRPLRFVRSCEPDSNDCSEKCSRCAMFVETHISTFRGKYGFFLMARPFEESDGFRRPGRWNVISTRINKLSVLDHDPAYDEYMTLMKSFME